MRFEKREYVGETTTFPVFSAKIEQVNCQFEWIRAGADLCDDGDVAERARKIGETNDGLSRPSKFEYDAWEAVTS